ncbi:Basic-leucine zipper (bZIP) transcription factor [Niveomyces insectorum RCEF 264]|uniref:Basic-leucine zipper (BZIP) transcription factor n=1 Tax=Niveomyces insectorum RCEF 264 TaxID=1081102 RepID=A0A167Y3J6_9HYPO|nr:Basic-leucine zipper (bZIP) transcription factor [Niveomyces insectorum RCEF 264]
MTRNIFRLFNPTGPQEDRLEKRRAQLRQAQQTYRERKDRYTKALEADLARSRAEEARLWRENERLQSIVSQLTVHCPADVVDIVLGGQPAPVLSSLSPASAGFSTPLSNDYGLSPPAQSHTPSPSARLGDLDPVELGMEFVLTLEEPCLGHLNGDPSCPHNPNQHSLTVSGKLCSFNTPPPIIPFTAPAPGSLDYKTTPKAILESMLSLSSAIGAPDNGITPVQAWHRIRAEPHFSRLALGSLRALAATLRDLVKCHGYEFRLVWM